MRRSFTVKRRQAVCHRRATVSRNAPSSSDPPTYEAIRQATDGWDLQRGPRGTSIEAASILRSGVNKVIEV